MRKQALNKTAFSNSLSEAKRTQLIGEIATVLTDEVPPETKAAALTLIGWLARRMPDDDAAPTSLPRDCG